jgi:hypothetical protein
MDLISDALPFTPLWYDEPDAIANGVSYAKLYSRSTKILSAYRRARSPQIFVSERWQR